MLADIPIRNENRQIVTASGKGRKEFLTPAWRSLAGAHRARRAADRLEAHGGERAALWPLAGELGDRVGALLQRAVLGPAHRVLPACRHSLVRAPAGDALDVLDRLAGDAVVLQHGHRVE